MPEKPDSQTISLAASLASWNELMRLLTLPLRLPLPTLLLKLEKRLAQGDSGMRSICASASRRMRLTRRHLR